MELVSGAGFGAVTSTSSYFGGFAGVIVSRRLFPASEARCHQQPAPVTVSPGRFLLRGRLVCGDGVLDLLLLEGGHYLGSEEF